MKKKQIILKLRRALKMCDVENASFVNDKEEDIKIKKHLQFYIDSWIKHDIELAIQELEK